MNLIEVFRKEVYKPLGDILKEEGDGGFIKKGPDIVFSFFKKHPQKLYSLKSKYAEEGYTRKKVICDDGLHAVRCMEWCPNAVSPIHEHGGRPCFDIVLEGELDIVDYSPNREGNLFRLVEKKRYSVSVGDFVKVDPFKGGEIHEVINGRVRSRSLHFYPIDHRSLGLYKRRKDGLFEYDTCDVPND